MILIIIIDLLKKHIAFTLKQKRWLKVKSARTKNKNSYPKQIWLNQNNYRTNAIHVLCDWLLFKLYSNYIINILYLSYKYFKFYQTKKYKKFKFN